MVLLCLRKEEIFETDFVNPSCRSGQGGREAQLNQKMK